MPNEELLHGTGSLANKSDALWKTLGIAQSVLCLLITGRKETNVANQVRR